MRSEFLKQQSPKVLKIVKFDESVNAFVLHDHLDLTEINLSALAEINYGWDLWQHQQSKVDEARAKAQMCRDEKTHAINRWSAVCKERDELQKRVDTLTLALDQIAYPIQHMQKEAELNGCELNWYLAVKMSEDHTYSEDIARRALEKEQVIKGD